MAIDQISAAQGFAANRARGAVAFDVAMVDDKTRRRTLHESGSLRVRFPAPEDGGLSAVFVNTAGGVAGGDEFAIDIKAGENARLAVTTAAAEKVYRSHGPAAQLAITLHVASGARLAWLPQETILFDQARVVRSIDVTLDAGATMALCEIVVFGRTAMGERMTRGSLVDRWRLRIAGKLVFAENVRLDDDIAATLTRRAIAGGGVAIATALLVPGDEAVVERIRACAFASDVGISAWNGFAMVRVCAQTAVQARADMVAALKAAGVTLPRLWLN